MEIFDNLYDKVLSPFNYDLLTFMQFMFIILIFLLFSMPLSTLVIKVIYIITNNKSKVRESSFYRPLKYFFCFQGLIIATYTLSLSDEFFSFLNKAFRIMCILLTAKGLANLFTNKKKFKFLKVSNSVENKTLASFFDKIIVMLIYVVASFMIIYELGYNLNGLVAGLGIGSAVIALAAQDVVKSLIASFVIITEKPFVVGDFIETDSFKGTVEDITFRSTVVRTNDKSLVSIPSSKIAESYVLNWSRTGGKRRYEFDIGLTLETPLKKINEFIESLRLELSKLEEVEKDTISIHMTDIKSDCINVYSFVYLAAKNYDEYLEIKEKVNYIVLNVAYKNKIELAYPTKTVYVKK